MTLSCPPQAVAPEQHGIVLFAHGSRDPQWRAPIEAVLAQLQRQHPQRPALCAYLELSTPNLAQGCAQLIAQGVTHLTVVPMFLGTGRHAREDLPLLMQDLRASHPHIHIHLQPSIGENPRVTTLLADIAAEI